MGLKDTRPCCAYQKPRRWCSRRWSSVGESAFLIHDAVLALHGLGLVNPKKIPVGTPHRMRHEVPNFVEGHQHTLPADEVEVFEAISRTRVARAIIDSLSLVRESNSQITAVEFYGEFPGANGEAFETGLCMQGDDWQLTSTMRWPAR